MSTTRFWGEPDDGVKVRHAKGRPLYEMCLKILGWIRGKSMAGGFKVEGGLQKLQYVSQVMG